MDNVPRLQWSKPRDAADIRTDQLCHVNPTYIPMTWAKYHCSIYGNLLADISELNNVSNETHQINRHHATADAVSLCTHAVRINYSGVANPVRLEDVCPKARLALQCFAIPLAIGS